MKALLLVVGVKLLEVLFTKANPKQEKFDAIFKGKTDKRTIFDRNQS